jgi:5-methyltetrahydropteroyltriglutamate--homocysteine methyltransferase
MALATNIGYPRIGPHRELKRAVEAYWAGSINQAALLEAARQVRRANWARQRAAGLHLVPVNDFSLYDHVLDTIALTGAVPARYRWSSQTVDLDTYFAMARGAQRPDLDVPALELTKWFDTNYHYLVPDFEPDMRYRLASEKPCEELAEAQAEGIPARPVLLGPLSFVLLGKADGVTREQVLDAVLEVYATVLQRLVAQGAQWIQLDEPCLVQDRTPDELALLERAYARLAPAAGSAQLLIQTYFGEVGEAYPYLVRLPVHGIGLDFVRGREPHLRLLQEQGFPADKWLAAGVINGRNVWAADLDDVLGLLRQIAETVPADRLMIQPSCSLMHVPIDVQMERQLDPELKSWLAFADQKLTEVVALTQALNEGEQAIAAQLAESRARQEARRRSPRLTNPAVRERLAALDESAYHRASPYLERRKAQRAHLNLPLLPTTTIGSFPQTPAVRRMRRRFYDGEISQEEYERFLEQQIARVIRLQEELGLDVLVHGEYERTDMVEYFGMQLEGFAFTEHGWVQSYGSRYVKPPILYGDVQRKGPMTVRWSTFAQAQTTKPVKGMLTGPVTILNWSFVREDQPRSETCRQIALAIRDEVLDLERAGLRVIQVDEPALREGLPLRRAQWQEYLDWAVRCFRLATSGVKDSTQMHTHMCYSDFEDIIDAIAALDADVLSIENARSEAVLLEVFRRTGYPQEIGPGVYDIHSPRIPSVEEIEQRLRAALEVLRPEQLWVNPDCGLKTRSEREVIPALTNMVEAARRVRASLGVRA